MKRIKKEHKTKTYFKGLEIILFASHWVDSSNGERIKIPQGLKTYYHYRYFRYKSFSRSNKPYMESSESCGAVCGVSASTIKKIYNPLLKRMGLLIVEGHYFNRDINYNVLPIQYTKGCFINEALGNTSIFSLQDRLDYKINKANEDKHTFEYEHMKVLEHNKELSKELLSLKDEKYIIMSQKRKRELLTIERQYKQGMKI